MGAGLSPVVYLIGSAMSEDTNQLKLNNNNEAKSKKQKPNKVAPSPLSVEEKEK